MKKPKMNYSKMTETRVLCDPSYGEIGICKRCKTTANLGGTGYCEACFDEVKNR